MQTQKNIDGEIYIYIYVYIQYILTKIGSMQAIVNVYSMLYRQLQ